MKQFTEERHRVKVSVTVDPDILDAVDTFVGEHPGLDRSKVFGDALHLWYAQQQAKAMEEQFTAPQSEEERQELEGWRHVRRTAAKRTLRSRRA